MKEVGLIMQIKTDVRSGSPVCLGCHLLCLPGRSKSDGFCMGFLEDIYERIIGLAGWIWRFGKRLRAHPRKLLMRAGEELFYRLGISKRPQDPRE